MGLTSNTGLLASVPHPHSRKQTPGKMNIESTADMRVGRAERAELRCSVTRAPFVLRPYAGLYNPFARACSVLCNHPAGAGVDHDARHHLRRARDAWVVDGKGHYFGEDLARFQDISDKEKMRTPHDIVTEDMFRRYTETDSRPLTPAPTLASGKSRGSRRCLTPDQPHPRPRAALVLDLRRSHSQVGSRWEMELPYRYTETDSRPLTPAPTLASGKSRGSRRCLTPDQPHPRPRAALVLDLRRSHSQVGSRWEMELPYRYTETDSRPLTPAPTLASGKSRGSRRCLTPDQPHPRPRAALVLDLRRSHSQETLYYHGYSTSEMTIGRTTTATDDRSPPATLPSLRLPEGAPARPPRGPSEQLPPLASPLVLAHRAVPVKEYVNVRTINKNQLKALNLGKSSKGKNKGEGPAASQSQRSEGDAAGGGGGAGGVGGGGGAEDGGEMRRRGRRRRRGARGAGGGAGGGAGAGARGASAGLAAPHQDPETQVAGIGTDSHNPSSRGSVSLPAPPAAPAGPARPARAARAARHTDSFLDDDILKYLHREVDEEAIETEFDIKRKYVLEEAYRTRPERARGRELHALLRELHAPPPAPAPAPPAGLADWLHVPRVFSRRSATFALPIDSTLLSTLTAMQYAARFVTLKKSKQLLYLTVLRKFNPEGYRMPIKNIEDGLVLMMGGILTAEQVALFRSTMEWESYVEEEHVPDEIRVTLLDAGRRRGAAQQAEANTIKYRTWCGVCAVCERAHGRLPPRDRDPPDGMELSDFSMIESKLAVLKVHSGLAQVLNTIRLR